MSRFSFLSLRLVKEKVSSGNCCFLPSSQVQLVFQSSKLSFIQNGLCILLLALVGLQRHGGNFWGDKLTSAEWASLSPAAYLAEAENRPLCPADSTLTAGQALGLAISMWKKISRCLFEHRVYLGVWGGGGWQIQVDLPRVVPSCSVRPQSPGGFGGVLLVPFPLLPAPTSFQAAGISGACPCCLCAWLWCPAAELLRCSPAVSAGARLMPGEFGGWLGTGQWQQCRSPGCRRLRGLPGHTCTGPAVVEA